MNNTITEMKNKLEWITRRITEAEEQISELEDRLVKITAMKRNKEKGGKHEFMLRPVRAGNGCI